MSVKQSKRILRTGVMLALVVGMAASLSGCGRLNGLRQNKGLTFDGQTFNASAKGTRGDVALFTSTVRQPQKSLDGAIEAATYQGVKYCINTFGTSDIRWSVGPDTPREQLVVAGDTLSLTGRCNDP